MFQRIPSGSPKNAPAKPTDWLPGLPGQAEDHREVEGVLAAGLSHARAFVARLGLQGARVLNWPCRSGVWASVLEESFETVHLAAAAGRDTALAAAITGQLGCRRTSLLSAEERDAALRSGSYDAVVTIQGLWHCGLRGFLAGAEGALRPGGLAFFSFTRPEHLVDIVGLTHGGGPFPEREAAIGELEANCLNLVGSLPREGRMAVRQTLLKVGKPLRWGIGRLLNPEPAKDPPHARSWGSPDVKLAVDAITALRQALPPLRWGSFAERLERLASGYEAPVLLDVAAPTTRDLQKVVQGSSLDLVAEAHEGLLVASGHAVPPAARDNAARFGEALLRKPEPLDPHELSADRIRERATEAPAIFRGMVLTPMRTNVGAWDGFPVDEALGAHFLRRANRVPRDLVLTSLVEEVTRGAMDDDARFLALYRFVQDGLFHHPVLQLTTPGGGIVEDPVAILLAGIARCGHVARVVLALFDGLGLEGRIVQLHKHIVAEVRDFSGAWRLIDCDLFRAGVVPRTLDGRWASLEDAQQDPGLLDALPALGYVLPASGEWAKTRDGETAVGYVETGLPWERPYTSHYYFGGRVRKPVAPASIQVEPTGGSLLLRAVFDRETAFVNVSLSARTRGWSYSDRPDARFLEPLPDEAGSHALRREDDRIVVDLGRVQLAQASTLFINVVTLGNYAASDNRVFTWPGHEISVPLPSV